VRSRDPGLAKRILFATIPTLILGLLCIAGAEILLRTHFAKIEHITSGSESSLARYGDLSYHWDRHDRDDGWTNAPGYRSDEQAPFRLSIGSRSHLLLGRVS